MTLDEIITLVREGGGHNEAYVLARVLEYLRDRDQIQTWARVRALEFIRCGAYESAARLMIPQGWLTSVGARLGQTGGFVGVVDKMTQSFTGATPALALIGVVLTWYRKELQ